MKFEGSSEVNIVVFEGVMMYFACKVARRASLKPATGVRMYVTWSNGGELGYL